MDSTILPPPHLMTFQEVAREQVHEYVDALFNAGPMCPHEARAVAGAVSAILVLGQLLGKRDTVPCAPPCEVQP